MCDIEGHFTCMSTLSYLMRKKSDQAYLGAFRSMATAQLEFKNNHFYYYSIKVHPKQTLARSPLSGAKAQHFIIREAGHSTHATTAI